MIHFAINKVSKFTEKDKQWFTNEKQAISYTLITDFDLGPRINWIFVFISHLLLFYLLQTRLSTPTVEDQLFDLRVDEYYVTAITIYKRTRIFLFYYYYSFTRYHHYYYKPQVLSYKTVQSETTHTKTIFLWVFL